MAVQAITSLYVAVASATSGGTAPGGAVPPTGAVALTSPVDISQWVTAVESGGEVDAVDANTFGSGGYSTTVAGIVKGKLDLSIYDDYAAGAIHALLGPNGSIAKQGQYFFVEIRPTSAARSASNPGWLAKVIHLGSTTSMKVGAVPEFALSVGTSGAFGELIA